jgi:RHS repeat-associated protein
MPADFGYTGQRLDGTGLMFYHARYYAPSLGRFIQADTIILNPDSPQDFNRYTYVRNNPLLYIDPTGHYGCIVEDGDEVCRENFPDDQSLSLEEAQELFDLMAGQDDIAFGYLADGCYARAHLMAQRMAERGIEVRKVWTFPEPEAEWISVDVSGFPDEGWRYHVAPTVSVIQEDGTVQRMVIDPSLFDSPVTIEEWVGVQKNVVEVVEKRPDEPPNPESWYHTGVMQGGSGYMPGRDPNGGPDAHARMRMAEYKQKERRQNLTIDIGMGFVIGLANALAQ